MKYKVTAKNAAQQVILDTTIEAPSLLVAIHAVTQLVGMLDEPTFLNILATSPTLVPKP